MLGETDQIVLEDLPAAIQDFELAVGDTGSPIAGAADTLEEIEVSCILQAMAKTQHNRTQAARLLGISRRTLGYRIEKYSLAEELKTSQASPG